MTNANKVVTAVERPLTVLDNVTVAFAVARMSATEAGVVLCCGLLGLCVEFGDSSTKLVDSSAVGAQFVN